MIMNNVTRNIAKRNVLTTIYTIVEMSDEVNFSNGELIINVPKYGKIELEEMFFTLKGEFICYFTIEEESLTLDLDSLDLETLLTILQHIIKK